ncbi:recombinase family protein [Fusobacterium varium]
MGKIIGYARVSTKKQMQDGNSIEQQRREIQERYSNAEIIEESYSGAKERPKFNKILISLNEGDILVVTKLDRFCRTTKEGLTYIDELLKRDVKIHILNMGLIENTPMGRLIVTNLLAFAEFERSMIIERTQGGKEIAKGKDGYREGRPNKFIDKQLTHALSMLQINGGSYSYKEVEEITNISKSTLIRANNKRKLING